LFLQAANVTYKSTCWNATVRTERQSER